MEFIPIDKDHWARKSHFDHYSTQAKCTFNTTVVLDITALHTFLRAHTLRLYPACIALISQVANTIPECKMVVDAQGRAGYWKHVAMAYPLFHKDDNSFTLIYSEYKTTFGEYYQRIVADMELYKDTRGLFGREIPAHTLCLSCVPWLHFSSFTLQLFNDAYLAPVITWGKYTHDKGRLLMPMAVQAHHAAMDAYHVALFLNTLQELAAHPETLSIATRGSHEHSPKCV